MVAVTRFIIDDRQCVW